MAVAGLALAGHMVTVLDAAGHSVLHQNPASLQYYGERVGPRGTGSHTPCSPTASQPDARSVLEQLFELEPQKLEWLLDDVLVEGKPWKGMVQVPCDLLPPQQRGAGSTPAGRSQLERSLPGGRVASRRLLGAPRTGSQLLGTAASSARNSNHVALLDSEEELLERAGTGAGRASEAVAVPTSFHDLDPLATSTWGTLLEGRGQGGTPSASVPSAGTGTGPGTAPVYSSVQAASTEGKRASHEHSGSAHSGAYSSVHSGASGALLPARSRRPAPAAYGCVVEEGPEGVEGLEEGSRVHIKASPLRRSSSTMMQQPPPGHPGAQDAVAQAWGAMVTAMHAGAVGGAAAAGTDAPQPGGAPTRRAPPRRSCTTRDLSASPGNAAPLSRMIAFAASLKNSPSAAAPQLTRQPSDTLQRDGAAALAVQRSGMSAVDFGTLARRPGIGLAPRIPSANARSMSRRIMGEAGAQPPCQAVQSMMTDMRSEAGSSVGSKAAGADPQSDAPLLHRSARRASMPHTWMESRHASAQVAGAPQQSAGTECLLVLADGDDKEHRAGGAPASAAAPVDAGRAAASSPAAAGVAAPVAAAAALPAAATAAGGGASVPPSPTAASSLRILSTTEVAVNKDTTPRWHEVSAVRCTDPVSGCAVLLLAQVDVTAKVTAERHLALVSETEHRLLEQIFPRHVLAYMTEEGGPWDGAAAVGARDGAGAAWRPAVRDINKLATFHPEVTLLFADIQGFTPMCKVMEPITVMRFLNDLFSRFDAKLDTFGVYKVETIDCYMVAGGLIHQDEDGMAAVITDHERSQNSLHAYKVFAFAKAMLSEASKVLLPTTGTPVRMRVGLHTGPVMSGVVGTRMPRFCLFGDTVNTTSRMESSGVPGCIHVSDATHAVLREEAWTPTGGIEVKGKGLMETYLWCPDDMQHVPEQAGKGQLPQFPRSNSMHPTSKGTAPNSRSCTFADLDRQFLATKPAPACSSSRGGKIVDSKDSNMESGVGVVDLAAQCVGGTGLCTASNSEAGLALMLLGGTLGTRQGSLARHLPQTATGEYEGDL